MYDTKNTYSVIELMFVYIYRKAVAEHTQAIPSARVEELRSSPGDGSISPGSQSSGSDRIDRDRQRLREQERRKREAVSNEVLVKKLVFVYFFF